MYEHFEGLKAQKKAMSNAEKKEAKAAAETTNVVGQRIEEDREAEAAAERDEAGKSGEIA